MSNKAVRPTTVRRRPAQSSFFPRIVGLYVDESASSYYRIRLPLSAMRRAGFPVGWGHVSDCSDAVIDDHDVILFSRLGGGDARAVLRYQRQVK